MINSIVKIIGLFECQGGNKNEKQVVLQLIKSGFLKISIPENLKKFYKDNYYPGFRDILFIPYEQQDVQEGGARTLTHFRRADLHLSTPDFLVRNKSYVFRIRSCDVFVFSKQMALFSLEMDLSHLESLEDLSDNLNILRSFDTEISQGKKWADWISEFVLGGIEFRGDQVSSDNYSGSKFKLFNVVEIEATSQDVPDIDYLLYDLGCCVPIGSAKGLTAFAPTDSYFQQIMHHKIDVFRNWRALALFDSFTCIGTSIIENEGKRMTWGDTYHNLYIYRLFLKFALFQYNSITDEPVQLKTRFEHFLNIYNLEHISYNFLPNIIYNQIGKGLNLPEELKFFRDRISNLSQEIEQNERKRINKLLSIVSVITFLTGLSPILIYINIIKDFLNIHPSWIFYTLLSLFILGIALVIIEYVFPGMIKKWWRKIF